MMLLKKLRANLGLTIGISYIVYQHSLMIRTCARTDHNQNIKRFKRMNILQLTFFNVDKLIN